MNKKISLGAALALMLIITAVTFSVTMIFSRQMFSTTITNISEKQAMYDKLSEIDSYVRQNYYGTIDETNLNDYISTGYIAGLSDRYAAYYSASDYSALQQENVVCTPLQALIQQPCMLLVLRHNQRRPPVLDAGDRIRENLRIAVFAFDHQLI